MALLGIFSGLLFVPLNALLQWRSPADRRGAVIAMANVLVYGGMLVGSVLALVLAQAGVSPRGTFLGVSIVLLAGFLWALSLVPDAFLRFLLLGLAHTIYRVRVVGPVERAERGGRPAGPQPRLVRRRAVRDRQHRPAGPVRGLCRYFEQAVHRLGPAVDEGDPDLGQRRAEDDPAGVPRGRPGTRRGRARLRVPRGPAHADRHDGAVSARA